VDAELRPPPRAAQVGQVIGEGGSTIRGLQDTTGARIDVERNTLRVNVRGRTQAVVDAAVAAVEAKLAEDAGPPRGGGDHISGSVSIGQQQVGQLIGAGGETIRELQASTGARIDVDRNALVARVRGPTTAVVDATIAAIHETLAGGEEGEDDGNFWDGDGDDGKYGEEASPEERQQQRMDYVARHRAANHRAATEKRVDPSDGVAYNRFEFIEACAPRPGFGRVVVSEREAPALFSNMVSKLMNGSTKQQNDRTLALAPSPSQPAPRAALAPADDRTLEFCLIIRELEFFCSGTRWELGSLERSWRSRAGGARGHHAGVRWSPRRR
jgi:hypothetical protein